MEKPIERIVDAYVCLKNRHALEDLMKHRQRIAVDLAAHGDFDVPLGQIKDEIAVIEAGMQKLQVAER
jgi:hypothetical protein